MKVLGFLPGYYWTGSTLKSTGAALPPTQHMDPETGEVVFYVRPFFDCGPTVGLFIKRSGLMRAIAEGRA
jgi:hypothetical protein